MNFKELFMGDKKLKLLCLLGFAAIAVIFLLTIFGKEGKKVDSASTISADTVSKKYEEEINEQVSKVVSSIEGVGKANVTVTMESGVEYVYVKEEKQDTDQQTASGNKVTDRTSLEQKIIYVEDENGRKQALLKTTLAPKIRGAIIVCEGGDNPLVAEKVTNAVSTMLGIPSSKVCVTKLS